MANEVKILITAIDKASGTLNKIQSELTQTGQTGKTSFMGMASGALAAVGGVAAIGTAVSAAANFVRGSVNDWANYNEEIRKLSIATGSAPEDISRMMQAADDLGVSMDSLQTAFKLVAKNGIQPTIENIAKLSDDLLAIEDPTKRAEEAARLFGRQWAEIAPFVLAGGDAIREGTAAINDNLVATQESIDKSREYKVQLDNLADAWTGVKNSIAMEAMPVMTDATAVMNEMATNIQSNTIPAFADLAKAVFDGQTSFDVLTSTLGAYMSGMITGADVTNIAAAALGRLGDEASQIGPDMAELVRGVQDAGVAVDDLATSSDEAAASMHATNAAMGYVNQAIGAYITNADLAQQAQDALALATGELSIQEIQLRENIQTLTAAMDKGMVTPAQWATLMEVLADETLTAAEKVAYLRGEINKLKDKEVTITVNYEYTGYTAAGAAGVNLPGITGNYGGGNARLPSSGTPVTSGSSGAYGLDMIIPPGYDNDSYPIFASSGERAVIIPKSDMATSGGGGGLGGVVQNFYIYQQPGQSAAALANLIAYQASRRTTARAAGIKYAGH